MAEERQAISDALAGLAASTRRLKAGEYVRYDGGLCLTTNAIESAFSIFRDTLMRLLASDNLEYKGLTKAA
jgi:hypothetical protein